MFNLTRQSGNWKELLIKEKLLHVDTFEDMVAEKQLIPDGYRIKDIPESKPPGYMLGSALKKAKEMPPCQLYKSKPHSYVH